MSNEIYAAEIPQPNKSAYTHFSSQQTPPGYSAPPPYHYQPQRTSGCFGFFFKSLAVVFALLILLFALLFGAAVMVGAMVTGMGEFAQTIVKEDNRLTEKLISGTKTAKSKVAVISVSGVITGEEDGFIVKQIRQVLKDRDVKAVVLRVESPGGTLTGSDYYYHLLKKMKKERNIPVVVSMGSVAASGGYFVSMVGDTIYAEESSVTGSIGVIFSVYNGSKLLEKIGVESTPITSGPHKTIGSFTKPMTKEEQAILQEMVDESFERFKTVIKEGRKNFAADPAKLDKLATGRVFSANVAKQNGLIDEIGFQEDAIKKAMDLAGLTEGDCKAVKYKTPKELIESLFGGEATGKLDKWMSVKTLSDATTPRIEAICPYVLSLEYKD